MKTSKQPNNDKNPIRMEPYTVEWERLANELARSFVHIIACKKCGSPVAEGYCCTFCGTTEPR